MSDNLTIESPDFDKIRKETGQSTEDAIRLLWFVANAEGQQRRRDVRLATDRRIGKVFSDAPSTQQDNYDIHGAFLVKLSPTSAFDLTGIRNGNEGEFIVILNLGTQNITIKHESASSDAPNRIVWSGGFDKTLSQDFAVLLQYADSRWRGMNLA